MNTIIDEIFLKFDVFLLIFMRISGIFIITPIFSRKNIPMIYKIVISIFFSLVLVSTVNVENIRGLQVITVLIKELSIGLLMGFISYLFFISFFIAGQVIDMQIGFGMVNVFDPQSNAQVPISGNFYYIMALLIFLTIDGHHILLTGIIDSYNIIPINGMVFDESLISLITKIFGEIFIIGFKISSPVLATIFIVNVFLGILARTMPQMNVFIVGMPLKIIVGIVTVIVVMPLYIILVKNIFGHMYEQIQILLKILSKG
ncbi:flagellar biosynthetic protein FliR [Clostridiisalibacter paucivorans]|uniref:flagellar biosynthetic protein FliR n=1 Tax=Clostridiisalibacter paucivorans TaxID=408753 RepID=UPI00047B6697|nr:flagellar biosynthetic protein FliR [Clostridiisalibacter paucivorans]